MKVIEVSKEQHRIEGAGETGDPRVNPPTKDTVRHDSHMLKSRVEVYAANDVVITAGEVSRWQETIGGQCLLHFNITNHGLPGVEASRDDVSFTPSVVKLSLSADLPVAYNIGVCKPYDFSPQQFPPPTFRKARTSETGDTRENITHQYRRPARFRVTYPNQRVLVLRHRLGQPNCRQALAHSAQSPCRRSMKGHICELSSELEVMATAPGWRGEQDQQASLVAGLQGEKLSLESRVEYGATRNDGVWEMGDPPENSLTNGIVRHDSHVRKSSYLVEH
ncbi:hypothetical protein PR048_007327 [Dryococelus australis]|uniref:Uncharacterized protein n=1 Tax=Dryococelus australis TaxID=614101 RepID=A0ABQ9IDB8_9NEOP|nr:hypothetical protein PR048_007327 [Dryococelus australis]